MNKPSKSVFLSIVVVFLYVVTNVIYNYQVVFIVLNGKIAVNNKGGKLNSCTSFKYFARLQDTL